MQNTNELLMIFSLLEIICVIVVFAIFFTRSKCFKSVLEGKFNWKCQLFLMLSFGLFSIYGIVGGIEFMGAIINVCDLGPMAGGLFCGPFVGIGSGLIGAFYRFSLGGFSCIPGSLAPFFSGIFGSAIYLFCGKKFVGIRVAVIFSVLMEIFNLTLAFFMIKPYEIAVDIVSATFFPVILANTLGMFVFAFLIANVVNERKTQAERDKYQSELYKKKTELEIATRIQNGFLPKKIPFIKGFDLYAKNIPALEVGGDFYDVIPLPNGHFGLVIADVSGKGVPAALFMALSRTIVRASAGWHTAVTDAIEEANSLISEDSESGMFVTLFYGILDVDKRVLSYTNAGHNPPLALISGKDDFEILLADGIALGVIENQSYESGEISLGQNDLVVFYTDGVTEAINPLEEAYGEERFKSIIAANRDKSPEEILNVVLDDIRLFCGDEPQFDDITIMILKGN